MMKIFKNILLVISIASAMLIAVGCRSKKLTKYTENKPSITVSIPPIYGLVQAIVGEDFNIEVLLPEGAAPETFSPTIRQIAAVQNSNFFFSCNLMEFEKVVTKRIAAQKSVRVVNISNNCKLIENEQDIHDSECSHQHSHDCQTDVHKGHSHHHGAVDPHAWLSPFELEAMARNIGEAICEAYPDSANYFTNLEQLITKIKERQVAYAKQLTVAGQRAFLIYHPALSYLARDYDLHQISLENEGKKPTPASLAGVIDIVDKYGIKQMMYQVEYPQAVVKPTVDILGVNMVQINPLSANVLNELDRVVNIISE